MTHNLKEARITLGLSTTQLGVMLGLSPARAGQTVSDWTRGVRQMDEGRARLLQAYLDGYRPADWPQVGKP